MARVRPTALDARARTGDSAAVRALRISKQLDAFLTATQLGITLASLALGWLGEPALAELLHDPLSSLGLSEAAVHGTSAAIGFAVLSLLHIVVGELVPKSLAILRPESVARVHVGARREQALDEIGAAGERRRHQRRPAALALAIHHGAALEE